MRHKYLFITITLTFLFALNRPVFAQYPNWKNYTDGGYVYDICRQGNLMWIGTLGGLVRVNTLTNETTYFDKTNSGLPDNRVTSIAVDSSGKLWVGTYYGIGVYDGTNWIKYDLTPCQFVYW